MGCRRLLFLNVHLAGRLQRLPFAILPPLAAPPWAFHLRRTIVTVPAHGPSPFLGDTPPGTADTTLASYRWRLTYTSGDGRICSPHWADRPETRRYGHAVSTDSCIDSRGAHDVSSTDKLPPCAIWRCLRTSYSFMSQFPARPRRRYAAILAPSPPSSTLRPIATSMRSLSTLTPSTRRSPHNATTPLVTIPTPFVSSTTGTISPAPPLRLHIGDRMEPAPGWAADPVAAMTSSRPAEFRAPLPRNDPTRGPHLRTASIPTMP